MPPPINYWYFISKCSVRDPQLIKIPFPVNKERRLVVDRRSSGICPVESVRLP